MNLRHLLVLVGAVVLLVGVVGLLWPVSVPGPDNQDISCGNAIAADYSAARDADSSDPVNLPIIDQFVPNTDYVTQCESTVSERRTWSIPVAIIGLVVLVGGLLVGGRADRARAT